MDAHGITWLQPAAPFHADATHPAAPASLAEFQDDIAEDRAAIPEPPAAETSFAAPSPAQHSNHDLSPLSDHWSSDNSDDPGDPILLAASAAHEHWP